MSEYDFTQSFLDSESRKDQFSYSALKAMYEYYEQLEEDCDTQIEFDMVALCCEWTEYGSAYDAMKEYQPEDMPIVGEEGDDLLDIAEKEEQAALEWLQYRTQVIEFDDNTVDGRGVLVAQF